MLGEFNAAVLARHADFRLLRDREKSLNDGPSVRGLDRPAFFDCVRDECDVAARLVGHQ